jgi:hypothetical protein
MQPIRADSVADADAGLPALSCAARSAPLVKAGRTIACLLASHDLHHPIPDNLAAYGQSAGKTR